jgi:hypothetical protein
MHIGRAIIIPAVLALGVAGSLLSGPAMSAAAAPVASVSVPAMTAASAAGSGARLVMTYDGSLSNMTYD